MSHHSRITLFKKVISNQRLACANLIGTVQLDLKKHKKEQISTSTNFDILREDVLEAHSVGGRLNLEDFGEALNFAFCQNITTGFYKLEEVLWEIPELNKHALLARNAQNAWLIYLECHFKLEKF